METTENDDPLTNSVTPPQDKVKLQLLGGRIPMAVKTVDTLPQLWISTEMAMRLSSALLDIADRIKNDAHTLSHYGSSAKNMIRLMKGGEKELQDLLESHERLLGGTMHSLISKQISTIQEELTILNDRLGNRAKSPKK